MTYKTKTLFACLFLLVSVNVFSQGKVHVIKPVEEGNFTTVTGVSSDGKKVTGYVNYQQYSFIWDQENGFQKIDEEFGGSEAMTISNTGIVAGQFMDSTLMYNDVDYGWMPSRSAGYFKDGQWHSLGLKEGVQPTGMNVSMVYGISGDGRQIIGSRYAYTPEGKEYLEPVIWTIEPELSIRVLEHKKMGQGARPNCISKDGKVAGGFSAPYNDRTPVVWVDGEMREIRVNGIVQNGEVLGVSANGRYAALTLNYQAALYDIQEDRLTIIKNHNAAMATTANAVSNDGLVLGYYQIGIGLDIPRQAFIYTEALGMITLTDYLTRQNIQYPADFSFETTMGISEDGKTLVGFGQEKEGFYRNMTGWCVEIDKHFTGVNPARNLTAKEESHGHILLSWEEPTEVDYSWVDGYNLYRNGHKVNDEIITSTSYHDKDLKNGTYYYQVTAVWSGEESIPTTEVKVNTGKLPIPFYEDFSSGNLDSLYWNILSSTAYWQIDRNSGIPPSSLSYYNPIGTEYEESIVSPWIDAYYANDLHLSFNLYIPYTSVADSKDSIRVEVYDGKDIHTVASYGASDWVYWGYVPKKVDISEVAAGKEIQIRFTGFGENKGNFLVWTLDNINVYTEREKFRTERPLNVTVYRDGERRARINWATPKETAVLSYLPDTIVPEVIGNEGKAFIAASKFEGKDLVGYEGYLLTHIKAYLAHTSNGKPAKLNLVVFKGGKKIITQEIKEYTPNQWNTFEVDRTTYIDSNQPFYFGIEVVEHESYDLPVGLSDGVLTNAIDNGKNVINDGRTNLYSEDGGVTWKKLTGDSMNGSIAIEAAISKKRFPETKERLMGYMVYRNGYSLMGEDGYGNRMLTSMNNFVDLAAQKYTCEYVVTAFYTTQEESEMSDPAYLESIQSTTFAATGITEVDELFSVNGGKEQIVVSTDKENVLSIYSINGQLHSQRRVKAGETLIQLPAGIYIVKMNEKTHKVIVKE